MKRVIPTITILLVLLLTGCKSTEQTVIPSPIDITPSIEILFDSRPDNNSIDLVLNVTTIEDVVHNSAQYLKAWELWETYALGLEDYLLELAQILDES